MKTRHLILLEHSEPLILGRGFRLKSYEGPSNHERKAVPNSKLDRFFIPVTFFTSQARPIYGGRLSSHSRSLVVVDIRNVRHD